MRHLLPDRVYEYFVGSPIDTPNKIVLDASAVATAGASLLGWLPAVSALFSILWLALQMYGWFEQRRERRKLAAQRAALIENPDKR